MEERPIGNDTHSSASFPNKLKFVVSRNVFISFHTLNVRLVAVLIAKGSAPMVCVPGIPGAPTTRPSTRSAIKFYTARVKKIICRTLLLNLPTRSGASGMLRVLSDIDSLSSLSFSPIKLKPNIHDRRGEEHLSGRAVLQ